MPRRPVTARLAAACLPVIAASAALAQPVGITYPRQGTVCDSAGQVCYDQEGLSLGLTREYYGAIAEQTVLRNLGGQAPPKQFRLSEGTQDDGLLRISGPLSTNSRAPRSASSAAATATLLMRQKPIAREARA